MLNPEDFVDDAARIGCSVAHVRAVAEVESRGGGFDPEGFPKTLFEGHWFYRLTRGKFAASHPTLCFERWTKVHYGKSWQEEKARLAAAVRLDRNAALMSASWGMFQVMGFNHNICGFKTVQSFVTQMCKNENAQLEIFTNYVINSGLADELRDGRWADFARLYNGPEYKKNQYDVKLAKAYDKYDDTNMA
jgi:N-acetylmuramidase